MYKLAANIVYVPWSLLRTIHGPVCDRVRNVLKKESIFANTIVILFDDICGGIRNCR